MRTRPDNISVNRNRTDKDIEMKNRFVITLLLIFVTVLYDGCKKDIVSVDADFVGNWDMYSGHLCWIHIDNNNYLDYENENCGIMQCFERKSGNAKIKKDYIYMKDKLNIYVKEFHIDKYPYQELTTIQNPGTTTQTKLIWKMILSGGSGEAAFKNEVFWKE